MDLKSRTGGKDVDKYQVTFTAHIAGCVEVEADSPEEAMDKARPLAEESAPPNDHLELDWPPAVEEE